MKGTGGKVPAAGRHWAAIGQGGIGHAQYCPMPMFGEMGNCPIYWAVLGTLEALGNIGHMEINWGCFLLIFIDKFKKISPIFLTVADIPGINSHLY
jgi:hypothetical protein